MSCTDAADADTTTTHRVQWWWLVFLGFVIFQPGFDPDATALDWWLAAGIVVLYVPLYVIGERHPGPTRQRVVVASLVLGMLATPFNSGASSLFIYAGAFAGTFDPPARGRRWLAASFALLMVAAMLSQVPFPYNILSFGVPLAFIWFVGLSTMGQAEQEREAARLRIENGRVAHLATMSERDRIVRDLHDLLGHTLTAVVVRSQLVQRLSGSDPERARDEAAGIEAAARDALAAVRQTVSGYLARTISEEVAEARRSLASVSVSLEVDGLDTVVAPEVESALALVLREAVTNVVRHARASVCRVTLARDARAVRLDISDDGQGSTAAEGNGIRGIRERVAALGGRLERDTAVGTRLTIEIPVPRHVDARVAP